MTSRFDKLVGVVFPAAKQHHYKKVVQSREIVSSTPFQIALYFNVFYSIVFFCLNLLLMRWKILNDDDLLLKITTPLALGVWAITEAYRLYLGYIGNLQEKVAHLAAFFFITIFPQLLLAIFFARIQKGLLPLDRILAYYMLVFIAVELVLGYKATNRIIKNNTARFAVEYATEESDPTTNAANDLPVALGAALDNEEDDSDNELKGDAADDDKASLPDEDEQHESIPLQTMSSARSLPGNDAGLKAKPPLPPSTLRLVSGRDGHRLAEDTRESELQTMRTLQLEAASVMDTDAKDDDMSHLELPVAGGRRPMVPQSPAPTDGSFAVPRRASELSHAGYSTVTEGTEWATPEVRPANAPRRLPPRSNPPPQLPQLPLNRAKKE